MSSRLALLLLAALLLLTSCGAYQGREPSQEAPPAAASWAGGPSSPPMECLYYDAEALGRGMADPGEYWVEGELTAGLIPHHLVAADMIAGFFSLAARQQPYDALLIVSPSHFPETCSSDVVTASAGWSTPFGPVEADGQLVQGLLGSSLLAAEDNREAVEYDHGAAGLIPFVRRYLPGTPVAVCLLSNRLSQERLEEAQRLIAQLVKDRQVLLVASADCSHYLMPEEAALRDAETAQAIEAFDYTRILSFTDSNIDSPQTASVFLWAAQAGQAALVRLDHSSSPEKLPHAITNSIFREGITTYFVYAAVA